jgi:hypothetical protein
MSAMTKPLDVLLIESHPGDGEAAADRLTSAGHRVHRCYGDGDHTMCVAVTDDACPMDTGIDVALLARGRVTPRPTASEAAVTCALRVGVPVVENGPEALDPFEPYVAVRVEDDVVAACEKGAERGFDSLRAGIRARTERSLLGAGVDPAAVDVSFVMDASHLTVELHGPEVSTAVQQALGVRVLDALRSEPRTFGQVNVTYEPV